MELKPIDGEFTVCRLSDTADVNWNAEFCFFARTDAELSLVCRRTDVPPHPLQREDGWRAFRIEGTLDFSLVGILSKLTGILAENGIGVFAVSTYRTDYILVKQARFAEALRLLAEHGYALTEEPDVGK